MPTERYDVLVAGGGPAGCAAAIRAAQRGLSVGLFERDTHPRFHIGESFLPKTAHALAELGLSERVAELPHTHKVGAGFALGHETELTEFWFKNGLSDLPPDTLNIERAPFDALMFEAAREAGAEVHQGTGVRSIRTLRDGDVEVEIRPAKALEGDEANRTVRARYLVDASGQATLVGRHVGSRRSLPDLEKAAFFNHLTNVERHDGEREGFPFVIMCREGWFWFIPIDDERTSVGLVMDAHAARTIGVPSREMLAWGLARCPLARKLTAKSEIPERNLVAADFSYTCRPYAGPGYFLAGDSATFIDPIFSTGACLALAAGIEAADGIRAIVKEGASPASIRRRYRRFVHDSSSVFFRIVRKYYRHEFRELFLFGHGPFEMQRAVTSVLSGDVFPKPSFALRWRLRAFEAAIAAQRYLPVVPRREQFSLIEGRTLPSRAPRPVAERASAAR